MFATSASATDLPEPALVHDATPDQLATHAKALDFVKLSMCSQHYEALMKCEDANGKGNCSKLEAAALKCREARDTDKAAWTQLLHNAYVQCPNSFRAFRECMEKTASARLEDRKACQVHFMTMQICAAEHAVRHLDAQAERKDGKWTPPPMYDTDLQHAKKKGDIWIR